MSLTKMVVQPWHKASRSSWNKDDAYVYEQWLVRIKFAQKEEKRYLALDKDAMTPQRREEVLTMIRTYQKIRYMAQAVMDEMDRKYPVQKWRPKTKR